jgi:hypothetical protein
MSLRTQFQPMIVQNLTVRYSMVVLSVNGGILWSDSNMSRERVAYRIFLAKKAGKDFKLTRTWYYEEYAARKCFGCLARPGQWDGDCDGLYQTAECGKCKWWDAVEAREAAELGDALMDVQQYL